MMLTFLPRDRAARSHLVGAAAFDDDTGDEALAAACTSRSYDLIKVSCSQEKVLR